MKLIHKFVFSVSFILLPLVINETVLAADIDNQFITIVNPVRISTYTKDPYKSLETQYQVIAAKKMKATWLLTYDVLKNDRLLQVINKMDKNQEIGLFLEITPTFSKEADVIYNNTGFWHHATAVFLSGYIKPERIKLIDTVFSTFKAKFGYYPKAVGSWWSDSYSLSYMQKKYGVTVNLGCSDQFATDGYQIWGTYWSTPYYPNNIHSGIPASTAETKIPVVMLEWAPRDPYNGYFSSLYSTQDYLTTPQLSNATSYFEKLIKLYLDQNGNEFAQVTIGLESDMDPTSYRGEYSKQIKIANDLERSGLAKIVTMSEFAGYYQNKFPLISPPQLIKSDDLLGKQITVYWYQNSVYRIGLFFDRTNQTVEIFDLRTYTSGLKEPYYDSPNKEFDLSIYIPSILDKVNNRNDTWLLNLGEIVEEKKDNTQAALIFEKGKIIMKSDGITIETKSVSTPIGFNKNPYINATKSNNGIVITFRNDLKYLNNGYSFKALTVELTHLLKGRKLQLVIFLTVIIYLSLLYFLFRKKKLWLTKLIVVIILGFLTIKTLNWYELQKMTYIVSPGEVDALYRLKAMPLGKVLVNNEECLQCSWSTDFKPAVFANKRSYVTALSGEPIIYNASILKSVDRAKAKKEIIKLGVKYIYLVKFENYIEEMPFSPGDLGVEKIFENANAEIWSVLK